MRRAILPAAALLLAACVVDVEGAFCDQPGSTSQCPPGQACGFGEGRLECSERAAACVAAETFCVSGQDTRCEANQRQRCVAGDACGVWELVESCGALSCDQATDTCRCAAPGTSIYVDSGAGGGTPGLVPTGAQSPPGCRLPSISAGLASAAAGDTVHVVGAPAVYADLPIRVRQGVSLVAGDSPLDPAARILANAATAQAGVVLEDGARLEGFTVRATPDAAPRHLGIRVDCAGPDAVSLSSVRVDAPGALLAAGVVLNGSCPVALTDVEIAGATGIGLTVALAADSTVATMTRGVVDGNGTGISLTRGDLRLDRTSVVSSQGSGLLAGDGEADTRLRATDCLFKGNLDTAIQLNGNLQVDLQLNRICQNGAVTPRGSASRKVGGLFARGAPPLAPDLVFKGNELVGNAAAQLFVTGTTTRWTLDGGTGPAACASGRNLFGGYVGVAEARGLLTDAPMDARWNGWNGITPTAWPLGQDTEAFGTNGSIDAGAATGSYCDPVPAPRSCT